MTEQVTLQVHPGPAAANAVLSCSWHGACTTPPTPGSALDWENWPEAPVRWRSRGGWRSVGGGPVAFGTILKQEGTCLAVSVQVVDVFELPKERIRYSHSGTWTPGWTFTIAASPAWAATDLVVGFTLALEKQSCIDGGLWTVAHLHQDRAGIWWEVNRGNFRTVGSTYPVVSLSNWQYRQSWTWNY
uniref:Uncharacterized protein n=1 Tax=uncultured prokaryote TaxID=198431 RepID=H5SPJ7_9ZZZZ|nr:hypothetical protein HGMM_F54D01C10 [uncultured prokaryote]